MLVEIYLETMIFHEIVSARGNTIVVKSGRGDEQTSVVCIINIECIILHLHSTKPRLSLQPNVEQI